MNKTAATNTETTKDKLRRILARELEQKTIKKSNLGTDLKEDFTMKVYAIIADEIIKE